MYGTSIHGTLCTCNKELRISMYQYGMISRCVMAPQDYLQVWGFPGTHRTQHMVIFVAKINCNKGYKAVSKGEEWCKVQKISGASFQESSPTVVTYTHITAFSRNKLTTHVKCGLPWKLFRTQGFYWVLIT